MFRILGLVVCTLALVGFAGVMMAEEPTVEEQPYDHDAPFFVSAFDDEGNALEKFALQTFMDHRSTGIGTSPVPQTCSVSQTLVLTPPNNAGEFIHLQQTAQSTCGDCSSCYSAGACLGCLIGSGCGGKKTCNVVGCPAPAAKACCGCS